METRRKKKIKKMKSQEAHEHAGFLSDELIMYEILPWLPPKSLYRFKLVCKQWLHLISSDPTFITSQSQRCSNHCLPPTFVYQREIDDDLVLEEEDDVDMLKKWAEKLLFLSSTSKNPLVIPNPSLDYVTTKNKTYKQLKASTNGLLLGYYYHHECGDRMLYLTNPLTKSFVSIPCPPAKNKFYLSQPPGLAFYPAGNGDPFFVIVFPLLSLRLQFLVYSSKVGEWNTSNASASFPVKKGCCLKSKSVSICGKIYWGDGKYIVCFDFDKDSCGIMQSPSKVDHPFSEIGDCNGKLSYTEITKDGSIEIWVLNRCGESASRWIIMHSLDLTKLLDENMKIVASRFYGTMELRKQNASAVLVKPYEAKPLSYEGGDVVFFWVKSVTDMGDTGIIFSYDIRTRKLQMFQKVEDSVVFHSYKSSLASLPNFLFIS